MSRDAWKNICNSCTHNTSSLSRYCSFEWTECEIHGTTRHKAVRMGDDPQSACQDYKRKGRDA